MLESMKKRKHQGKTHKASKTQLKKKVARSREHAIERAKERYNLELSEQQIERIEFRIRQNHECLFLEKNYNRSIWAMRVDEVMVCVVYNPALKCLSTFLPIWHVKVYMNGEGLPNYNPEYHNNRDDVD